MPLQRELGEASLQDYEITDGTEKADEKVHFYFLTKTKWVLED